MLGPEVTNMDQEQIVKDMKEWISQGNPHSF